MSWPTLNVALKENTQYFHKLYRLTTNASVTISAGSTGSITGNIIAPVENNALSETPGFRFYTDYQGNDINRIGGINNGLVIKGLHPTPSAVNDPIIDFYNPTSSSITITGSAFQFYVLYINKNSKIDPPQPIIQNS